MSQFKINILMPLMVRKLPPKAKKVLFKHKLFSGTTLCVKVLIHRIGLAGITLSFPAIIML
jgi:hypothetical protein